MGLSIIGTGHSVPEKLITNDMLSEMVETSDEWIRTRTGISERHVLTNESLLDISVKAGREALENAGNPPIDALIFSTLQGDYCSPSMSCMSATALGLQSVRVIDINMGCSGFVYALDIADAYISAKKAKNILIICGEGMSRFLDWSDRSSCVLFGDGAGAVVVSEGDGLIDIQLTSNGNDELICVPTGREPSPFVTASPACKKFHMNGSEVYKFAVESVARDIIRLLEDNNIRADEPAAFVLHQANMRIISAIAHRLGIPEEKFPVNLSRFGNTSSASVPILLDEASRSGRIKKGDLLVLSAFGSGLATGAALIQY